MIRLSNSNASLICTRLDNSRRLKDYFKDSIIQGLIATKGLKAQGFFRNLRISGRRKKEKKNTSTKSTSSGYRRSKINLAYHFRKPT